MFFLLVVLFQIPFPHIYIFSLQYLSTTSISSAIIKNSNSRSNVVICIFLCGLPSPLGQK